MANTYNHKVDLDATLGAWDYRYGKFAEITLDDDKEITVSNTQDMDTGVLTVFQDGDFDLTLPGVLPSNFQILPDAGSITVLAWINVGGTIRWSMVGQYTVSQLSAPPNFAAVAASSSQINLTWENVDNETEYEIQVATLSDFSDAIALNNPIADATSYNHTGLDADTTRYYRIRAKGDGSTYSDSNWATSSATTNEAPSYDTDTQAYITATGRVSIGPQLDAFVLGLKADGIWDRVNFWLLRGDLNSSKFNLTDPGDTDIAGRLVQIGSGTFSSTGFSNEAVTPGAGLNTKKIPTSVEPSGYIGIGVWNNANAQGAMCDIGVASNDAPGSETMYIQSRDTSDRKRAGFSGGVLTWNGITDDLGFTHFQIRSGEADLFGQAGSQLTTNASAYLPNSVDEIVISNGGNSAGSSYNYNPDTREKGAAWVTGNLSDAEILAFRNRIATLMNAI